MIFAETGDVDLKDFIKKLLTKSADSVIMFLVKESSWQSDLFMFASIRSDEEPLHI